MLGILSKKGFSLTEVIAAALVIVISAAGTFSAYLVARKFSNSFQYKTMAANAAASIADDIRYRTQSWSSFDALVNDANEDGIPDAYRSIPLINYIALQHLNQKVSNLTAEYAVCKVWFDNSGVEKSETQRDALVAAGSMPSGREHFKKIIIKIKWDKIQ